MTPGVVICAYTEQRWDLLVRAVASVEHQAISARVALVVDHNPQLFDRVREQWPAHLVIENRHARGLSGARNTGVESVGGDVVLFLDDDAMAHDGWLAGMLAAFEDETVGLAGGLVLAEWASAQPAWFPDEFLWVVGCSYTGLPTAPGPIRNPIGASMAVRRTVFDCVGGFVDGIGRVGTVPLGCEETELAIRAAEVGWSAEYRPDAVVSHHVTLERTTVGYFLRRCLAEGRSKAIVARETGSGPALASERAYVRRTVPLAIAGRLRRVITGPRRGSLGGAAAVVAGCGAAGFGYARAVLRPSKELGRVQLATECPTI